MSRKAVCAVGLGLFAASAAGCALADKATPAEDAWPLVERVMSDRYLQLPCETAAWGVVVTEGDTGSGPRCFRISTTYTAAYERDQILADIRAELPDARVLGRMCVDLRTEPSHAGPYCDAIMFVEPESWNVLLFTYVPSPDKSGYDVYVSSVALEDSNDMFVTSSDGDE